jgi:hypothetical protein
VNFLPNKNNSSKSQALVQLPDTFI